MHVHLTMSSLLITVHIVFLFIFLSIYKAKNKSSEKVDWGRYFHEQNERLKADLGLLPKKKKEKKKETNNKSSEKVDWGRYFHEQNERLKADLGLLPEKKKEKKREKKKETIWYYPRRNPYTGLIHHKTKPRKRSSGKKKDASSGINCYPLPLFIIDIDRASRGMFHKAVRTLTHDFTNDLNIKSQMGCSIIFNCIN